jgi:hypothetical protein
MRVIVDTSADRRIDPEVREDPNVTPAEAFRYPEIEVSCPVCDSRLAFRTSDNEVAIVGAGPNYTINCPVHGGPFEVDPRKASTAAKAMSRLALTANTAPAAGGVVGSVTGKRAGSVLSLDSSPGFTIAGDTITAAAQAAGVKTVNVVETQAGVYGNPRTTSFAVTIV